jgi:hypothetical protein
LSLPSRRFQGALRQYHHARRPYEELGKLQFGPSNLAFVESDRVDRVAEFLHVCREARLPQQLQCVWMKSTSVTVRGCARFLVDDLDSDPAFRQEKRG